MYLFLSPTQHDVGAAPITSRRLSNETRKSMVDDFAAMNVRFYEPDAAKSVLTLDEED